MIRDHLFKQAEIEDGPNHNIWHRVRIRNNRCIDRTKERKKLSTNSMVFAMFFFIN